MRLATTITVAGLGLGLVATAGCTADHAPDQQPQGALPVRADFQHCTLTGTPAGSLPRVHRSLDPSIEFELNTQVVASGPMPDGVQWVASAHAIHRVDDFGTSVFTTPERILDTRFLSGEAAVVIVDDGGTIRARWMPFDGERLVEENVVTLVAVDIDSQTPAGAVAVADDGDLFIAFGTGSDSQAAQDASTMAGSAIRIRVDDEGTVEIPADNPFVDVPGARPELWALGLRRPAGCEVIEHQGQPVLLCGEQGERYDEIVHLRAGSNHGWPTIDGLQCAQAGCPSEGFEAPLAAWVREPTACGVRLGRQVTNADSLLAGVVPYGDDCDDFLGGVRSEQTEIRVERNGTGTGRPTLDGDANAMLVDEHGVWPLEVSPQGVPGSLPDRLSMTECFETLTPVTPSEDLVPYGINAPLWTDGAHKRRWLSVPIDASIGFSLQGAWDFPDGTVLVKHFSLDLEGKPDHPVETRFMVRSFGRWDFHTYVWNDAGDEAELATAGLQRPLVLSGGEAIDYGVPATSDCKACHGFGAGRALGPVAAQLNRMQDYGGIEAGQLELWSELGLLDAPPEALADLPKLPDPSDTSLDPDTRFRAYLQANCAHCHDPEVWLAPDLRFDEALESTCDVPTAYPSPWVEGDTRIVPGAPEQSNLWLRLSTRGQGQMPLIGTDQPDPLGVEIVGAFIESLEECP